MTERGNPGNLRAAAQRKRHDVVDRAQQAIRALVRDGGPVNFRAVARLADRSPDFLYRTPRARRAHPTTPLPGTARCRSDRDHSNRGS